MSDNLLHAMEAVSVPSCPHCGTRPASFGRHMAVIPELVAIPPGTNRTERVELIWDCANCRYRVVLSATSPERFNRSVEPVAA